VVGGPHWQVLRHPALRPLLPGDVVGSFVIRDWGQLARYVPGGPPRGPALAALLKPERGAHVVLDVAGRPFAVMKSLGSGQVVFVAADLSEPPLRGWKGADLLWREILTVERPPRPEDVVLASTGTPFGGPSAGRGPRLASALMAIPVARPPSPWLLLAFLVIHLLQFRLRDHEMGGHVKREINLILSDPLWAITYIVGSLVTGFHVFHGFQAAFRSLGFNHNRYTLDDIVETLEKREYDKPVMSVLRQKVL